MKGKIAIFLTLICNGIGAQQSFEAGFSKSYLYEYEQHYDKAIKALQDLNAENYEIDLRLGWLSYLNKDYLKSEAYYRKAIALETSSVEGRFGLVLPLSALGNWSSVLTVYGEILKSDPNNSIANFRTASIYYNRNDFANCISYVSKVTKMYPFDFDSNLLYGKALIALGKKQDAKRYLEKALEYNPQSEDVKSYLKKIQIK